MSKNFMGRFNDFKSYVALQSMGFNMGFAGGRTDVTSRLSIKVLKSVKKFYGRRKNTIRKTSNGKNYAICIPRVEEKKNLNLWIQKTPSKLTSKFINGLSKSG